MEVAFGAAIDVVDRYRSVAADADELGHRVALGDVGVAVAEIVVLIPVVGFDFVAALDPSPTFSHVLLQDDRPWCADNLPATPSDCCQTHVFDSGRRCVVDPKSLAAALALAASPALPPLPRPLLLAPLAFSCNFFEIQFCLAMLANLFAPTSPLANRHLALPSEPSFARYLHFAV